MNTRGLWRSKQERWVFCSDIGVGVVGYTGIADEYERSLEEQCSIPSGSGPSRRTADVGTLRVIFTKVHIMSKRMDVADQGYRAALAAWNPARN